MQDIEYPILIDWLTFSCHFKSFNEAVSFLGLDEYFDKFVPSAPRWFYKSALTYQNITIYLSQNTDYTMACINCSGDGCRFIESFSKFSIDEILFKIFTFENFKVSRVDVAMDVISDDIEIDSFVDDTLSGNFVCRSKFYNIMQSSNAGLIAKSLYFGKKESNIFINIYDKRAERGYSPGDMPNWVRIEIRLRHENAEGFLIKYLGSNFDLGFVFSGILNSYLRFVISSNDSNKSRLPNSEYWQHIVSHSEKVKVFFKPGVEYNMAKYEDYLFKNCGSAIATYLTLHSAAELAQQISIRNIKPNAKQQFLIDNYQEDVDYALI